MLAEQQLQLLRLQLDTAAGKATEQALHVHNLSSAVERAEADKASSVLALRLEHAEVWRLRVTADNCFLIDVPGVGGWVSGVRLLVWSASVVWRQPNAIWLLKCANDKQKLQPRCDSLFKSTNSTRDSATSKVVVSYNRLV